MQEVYICQLAMMMVGQEDSRVYGTRPHLDSDSSSRRRADSFRPASPSPLSISSVTE